MGILKNSRNVPTAKEFLKWGFQDEQFDPWWRLQEGYHLQHVKRLANEWSGAWSRSSGPMGVSVLSQRIAISYCARSY